MFSEFENWINRTDRSVPHHSLLELVKPRRWDLLGIIKPSSGKWKSDGQSEAASAVMVWVIWKRPKKTECRGYCSLWVFVRVILFNPVKKTHFKLGYLTKGKLSSTGIWQTCSLNDWRVKVCGSFVIYLRRLIRVLCFLYVICRLKPSVNEVT